MAHPRQFFMRIDLGITMAGEVLAAGHDAIVLKTSDHGKAHRADHGGVRSKGPIAGDPGGRGGPDIPGGGHGPVFRRPCLARDATFAREDLRERSALGGVAIWDRYWTRRRTPTPVAP